MPLGDPDLERRRALATIARLAEEAGTPVYLVGGAVRDRLLGRSILDVDLAVDGDAVALARAVAATVSAELRAHEEFGTAVLVLEGGRRIDLARLRTEAYAAVAALPTVRPAALEEDLRRRDFTVNSMALPLAELDRAPIDPCGGRSDLESRLLRVHHERSFLDDPTRIIRGVRFEGRLGFSFEPATERLAREACAAGAVERLSADRLRAELGLLFGDDLDPEVAWRRLGDLGLVRAAGLRSGAAAAARLGQAARTVEDWAARYGTDPRVDRSRALLGALLLNQPPPERAVAARRIGLVPGHLERFEELVASLELPELLPHQSAAMLRGLELEELALVQAGAGPGGTARVEVYLTEQRLLELSIDGSKLLAHGFAPGPRIGEALRATRDARLDGRISSAEELEFALTALGGENGEP